MPNLPVHIQKIYPALKILRLYGTIYALRANRPIYATIFILPEPSFERPKAYIPS